MGHIGRIKLDTIIRKLSWAVFLLLGIPYLIAMVGYPFLQGDWEYVQSVWNRWQGLNVGVLALMSSLVAFYISRYKANKQRDREFTAALAFLPEALSELIDYYQSCASVLKETWPRISDDIRARTHDDAMPLTAEVPKLPARYKEIFSQCIRHAEPDVGNYLAYILRRLQVHHSRIKELINNFGVNAEACFSHENIISYMYGLAELHALTANLFHFAREEGPLGSINLSERDFSNAYLNMGIKPEQFEEVFKFTQRAIDRGSSDY